MIYYKTEDIFETIHNIQGCEKVIIPHICDITGNWNSEFAIELEKHFPEAKYNYSKRRKYITGDIDVFRCSTNNYNNMLICSMIARSNPVWLSKKDVGISYLSLAKCLEDVMIEGLFPSPKLSAEIHTYPMGTGSSNGVWNVISSLIKDAFGNCKIYVYCKTEEKKKSLMNREFV